MRFHRLGNLCTHVLTVPNNAIFLYDATAAIPSVKPEGDQGSSHRHLS